MKDLKTRRQALKRIGTIAGAASLTLRAFSANSTPRRKKNAPSDRVAVLPCRSYEARELRSAFEKLFDLLGGIRSLVSNKTVTIKINLTGMKWLPFAGMPAYESYQTHPATLAALCSILHDFGAQRIVVVECLYWDRPMEESLRKAGWNVKEIISAGGHRVSFEDTRNRGRWRRYSRFYVPWGGFIYPAFDFNQRYEKTDVLISLSKLKQHACAGVTMTVKNMLGATPTSLYGNQAPTENPLVHRTDIFHSARKRVPAGVPEELPNRFPRKAQIRIPYITADIYGARPVDLAIVDGIRTISGGEGWWNRGVKLEEPKLVLAGRNGVCVDAVGTYLMGFNPDAEHGKTPFPGPNCLRLLREVGLGTNKLEEIEIVGGSVEKLRYPFPAARKA